MPKIPQKRYKAFTLAELLIALGILGVIATFTIPKVLQSQQDNRRIAIFKETLSALQASLYEGIQTSQVNWSSYGTYMLTHLNSVKICSTNAQAEGCWTQPDGSGASNIAIQPGVVLANGAIIAGFDDTGAATNDQIIVDWNGPVGPNVAGNDQIVLKVYFEKDPPFRAGEMAAVTYPALFVEIFK